MALTSVLVLGPAGGFGQFLVPELIRRGANFKRVGAFIDNTRAQSDEKRRTLQDYAVKGVELIRGDPGDSTPFEGMSAVVFLQTSMRLSAPILETRKESYPSRITSPSRM